MKPAVSCIDYSLLAATSRPRNFAYSYTASRNWALGGDGMCATDIPNYKISARSNIIMGTWNVRTLRVAGKLDELTHEMNIYRWNILGL